MPDTPQNPAKPLKTALPAPPTTARAGGQGLPGPPRGTHGERGSGSQRPQTSEGRRAVRSVTESHRRTPFLAVLVAGGETRGSRWVWTAQTGLEKRFSCNRGKKGGKMEASHTGETCNLLPPESDPMYGSAEVPLPQTPTGKFNRRFQRNYIYKKKRINLY